MLALLPAVPAVALAPELRRQPGRLGLVQLPGDPGPPPPPADGVGEGAEVQVDVAVGVPAQAAPAEAAQGLAALLRRRGDVEQVLTEGALQVRRQVEAAGLWGGGR